MSMYMYMDMDMCMYMYMLLSPRDDVQMVLDGGGVHPRERLLRRLERGGGHLTLGVSVAMSMGWSGP